MEPLKILIADDNKTDRMILSAIVKKMGHDVLQAENGAEAVDQFQSHHPDIILLDVMMPVMDGQQAAREIKMQAGEDMVPIIFLTSLQDAHDLAACLDSGGDDFLTKPYKQIILQAKINAFSRMRRMNTMLQNQRDVIRENNEHLMHEQQVAKAVYDNVAHSGCLDLPNLKYMISPFSVFNGDVLLAARKPSGSLHILLGDFTGHGLPAAIGAMPLAEIFYGMTAKGFTMTDILREINIKLKTILPIGYFCCACMATVRFRSQHLEIWMGGLPDYYFLHSKDRKIETINSNHLPLGVLSSQAFKTDTHKISYEVGDKFFMWSDGILEARDEKGDLFGDQRLRQVFDENQNQDLLFSEILAAVNEFTGGAQKDDDTTLLEVSMVDQEVVGQVDIDFSSGAVTGPTDWNMSYTLRGDTLKTFNPLPIMLNIVNDVPALRANSGQLYTIMAELFSNAFEHGVLGLDSELKQDAEGFAQYYKKRQEAIETLEEGFVQFEFDHKPREFGGILKVTVKDSGQGFDYQSKLEKGMSDGALSGRGLALLKSLTQGIEYSGNGNTVTVTIEWHAEKELE
ncbi:SpoIIE family protein phosphatase [Bermanella marisrubri]|uniref:Response regulator containing a CheY-like receiver domain and a GGDEF domain n=1 Tax=Bermanella marisrubri TaxID=207949 RepID=Q1N2W0_9GAMM|nr:SpoIIE family protein phosphatase [Bermanella marisrubri]EAT12559.1 Response regulator containing a CheY-like receiver domain and a GGDEF domain [Oceanobacter sp. RED65] [Bermanella marisrubri]QIZ84884.1 SpoIIE family protein phosphatase [Bermanella marisrubri]